MPSIDYAATGIPGLDHVLGGGLPGQQMYLVRGASGTGKTTLSLQFLLEGARQGETVLYLGTSETEAEIRRIAASHEWSLDGVTLHHHQIRQAEEEQTMLHPAEMELPQTIDAMLAVVAEVCPSRVVIDSLAEIRVLARDELWYRRQLMQLKQHFSDDHCTVLLVEIPTATSSTLDTIVSGVVELQQTVPAFGPDRRRLRVAKLRGEDFSTGYHDYRIRRGGLEVFPRLRAADYRRETPSARLSTGLPALDTMLGGGLVEATSNLLLGPSGAGKSVLASQIAVAAAARGERCLLYVFDERVHTLFQRAAGIGLPLREHVDAGRLEVRQVDPTELTSGELSCAVMDAVQNRGVRMLLMDSLNGYASAMPEERLLGLYLHELTSYLGQQGVTSIFTMTQHGLLAERTDQPFDLSYIADTVVLLRLFEYAGQVHKAASVYKHRASGHETAIRELTIGPEGLRFGAPLRRFQGVLTGSPVFLGDSLAPSPVDSAPDDG